MNKEEIEEIETLEIDFKDTDDLELALEVSSKKAIYLIDDLIKHLFELQQENKKLKEQLLVAQTNEETFRLEMEDITKTLGLDEDTIFDDVKTYARSLKENKILRENAEHNDKVVDKVNWENMLLKKENQDLKKQLENYKKLGFKYLQDKNNNLENQQKEFIEYLEDLIKQNETVVEVSKYGLPKNCSKLLIDFYKQILQKYKDIIGDVKNEN